MHQSKRLAHAFDLLRLRVLSVQGRHHEIVPVDVRRGWLIRDGPVHVRVAVVVRRFLDNLRLPPRPELHALVLEGKKGPWILRLVAPFAERAQGLVPVTHQKLREAFPQ